MSDSADLAALVRELRDPLGLSNATIVAQRHAAHAVPPRPTLTTSHAGKRRFALGLEAFRVIGPPGWVTGTD